MSPHWFSFKGRSHTEAQSHDTCYLPPVTPFPLSHPDIFLYLFFLVTAGSEPGEWSWQRTKPIIGVLIFFSKKYRIRLKLWAGLPPEAATEYWGLKTHLDCFLYLWSTRRIVKIILWRNDWMFWIQGGLKVNNRYNVKKRLFISIKTLDSSCLY